MPPLEIENSDQKIAKYLFSIIGFSVVIPRGLLHLIPGTCSPLPQPLCGISAFSNNSTEIDKGSCDMLRMKRDEHKESPR